MKILDLYCKAGGAGMGLHRAFPDAEIVGVDIERQPNYPFTFRQDDALKFPIDGFDFIWASPPCQAHTVLKGAAWDKLGYAKKHQDSIPQTRERLLKAKVPYVIENVPGAPLRSAITLCGSMFGLMTNAGHQLRRHRNFECSFPVVAPGPCKHAGMTIGIFGNKARNTAAEKRHYSKPKESRGVPPKSILLDLADARQAMGIGWMSMAELSQAIPPSYSYFLASQLAALDALHIC